MEPDPVKKPKKKKKKVVEKAPKPSKGLAVDEEDPADNEEEASADGSADEAKIDEVQDKQLTRNASMSIKPRSKGTTDYIASDNPSLKDGAYNFVKGEKQG
jgi:hypothetical protein